MANPRRDRVRRLAAKRPPSIDVEVEDSPAPPGTLIQLVELLVQMLDSRRHSGRP